MNTQKIFNLIFQVKKEDKDNKQVYLFKLIAFSLVYEEFLEKSKNDPPGSHDDSLSDFCNYLKNDFEVYIIKARELFLENAAEYFSTVSDVSLLEKMLNAKHNEKNDDKSKTTSKPMSKVVKAAIIGAIATIIVGILDFTSN